MAAMDGLGKYTLWIKNEDFKTWFKNLNSITNLKFFEVTKNKIAACP